MKKTFLVDTEVFQGPLDLLLSLIEKRKLLISEISLAKITDDYLAQIDSFDELTLSQHSHFILVATTLLLIKSKSLLPTLELTYEEESSIEELEIRLKIFQKMKETEAWIAENFCKNPSYQKQDSKYIDIMFAPADNINLENLVSSAQNIINTLPKQEKIPHKTVKKIISLEESIVKLSNRIRQNISMSFQEFSNFNQEEKLNIVINFLAMLELVKQGSLQVNQPGAYQDIEMYTREVETPNYS